MPFGACVEVFSKSYDASLFPVPRPVEVKVDIAVLNIRSIKEADLTYTLDIILNLFWRDSRLTGPNTNIEDGLTLDSSWKSKIWTPSINFKNSVANRLISTLDPMIHLTIYNRTSVRLSTRLSLDLLCEMDFTYYPHDTQTCFLDIMSFNYNNKSVILEWDKFAMTSKLYLTNYYVHHSDMKRCDQTFDGLGTLSCVKGVIALKRFVGHFVIMKYIPSTIIVMMCFLGFWIPSTAHPARVALSMTSLLALITQQIQDSSIKVSYITALNTWSLICISFVFMSLVELALSVLWDSRAKFLEEVKEYELVPTEGAAEGEQSKAQTSRDKMDEIASQRVGDSLSLWQYLVMKLQTHMLTHSSNRVDSVARVLFPVLFLVASTLYFVNVTSTVK
ncbi:Glycine receptor subunit alphaZ1 [Halotydeus destructor]|nr:Glycine receptor subunit alphaZ1 [Halotydeus destructor]